MIDVESKFIKRPVPNEGEPSVGPNRDSVELVRLAENLERCRQQKMTITYL